MADFMIPFYLVAFVVIICRLIYLFFPLFLDWLRHRWPFCVYLERRRERILDGARRRYYECHPELVDKQREEAGEE